MWVGLAWLCGCPAPQLPAPEVEAVVPSYAYNGDDETVTIVGRKFYPQVALDAFQGDADVDRSFTAWLVGPDGSPNRYAFAGVGLVDDRHLTATLEEGMPAGRYHVEVESPTGLRGRLLNGFRVTDTEADKLRLEADDTRYSVTEEAKIRIWLLDPDDKVVPINFEIALVAVPEVGAIEYLDTTLLDWSLTPDADGVRGKLDNGYAEVTLKASLPTDVKVTVTAWSPSSVDGDDLPLTFDPGDDWRVDLRLPVPSEPRPAFTAGVPILIEAELVDQLGNPVGGRVDVDLRSECADIFLSDVELEGATAIEVIPTRACQEAVIEATGPAEGRTVPFDVVPGPAAQFGIESWPPGVLRAGTQMLAWVKPLDAFANPTTWTGDVTLTDSVDGLINVLCVGSDNGTVSLCSATPTRAAPSVTLLASGGGFTGVSDAYTVLPDIVPASLEVEVTGPAVAGEPHPVRVVPYDTWGNAMIAADLGPEVYTFKDLGGALPCTFNSYALDGAALFDCIFTMARPNWQVSVDLFAWSLEALSEPFEVVNGPLAVVHFEGEAPVVAGAPLSLQLRGEDAFGNRYVVQTDPVLQLWDDSGSFSETSATLGPNGTVTISGSFTAAGSRIVRAGQAGALLGSSDPITVLAGPATGLRVRPLVPWAFTDEPADIQVEAIDTYGNRSDWSGMATLSSLTTQAPPVALPLVNGVGVASFLWTEPSFEEILEAQAGAWTGEGPIVVSSRCGLAGPAAVVTFQGQPDAVACTGPDGTAQITADLSASTGTDLMGYALASLGGPTVADTQPFLDLELQGHGRHELQALVVDGAGCGAETQALGWTGPDDGTPTGPVLLSTTATSIDVHGTVTIDVTGVQDCTRDPASFGTLLVRTTGGALALPPTGHGLALQLDGGGNGSLSLTTDGGLSSGDSIEVFAVSESGAASGSLSLPLTGDNLSPIVLSQTPSGQEADLVSQILLQFSEPLLASTIVPSNFAVIGPDAPSIVQAVLAIDAVTLTLSSPVDASAGGYTVFASSAVRDLAGNRLSGDWSGGVASYYGGFGAAGLPPPGVSCTVTPSALLFRPDGDPGPDVEADELVVGVTSAVAPAWWVLEVEDELGNLVFLDRQVPLAATDTVTWNGRDLRGLIVDNGSWRVRVSPDDGLGNRGPACEVQVTLDNRGAPP